MRPMAGKYGQVRTTSALCFRQNSSYTLHIVLQLQDHLHLNKAHIRLKIYIERYKKSNIVFNNCNDKLVKNVK